METTAIKAEPFTGYITRLRDTLKFLISERLDQNQQNLQRGIPPFFLREFLNTRPIDVSIAEQYGGRGADPEEILTVLDTVAYESLPLGLILGINGALFAEPMSKYADPALAGPVLRRMREDNAMGGLMITEPDHGTDALNMQTHFQRHGDGYRIKGEKHWAGLSGWADYWIVTARRKKEDGSLSRDIGFFFCDSRRPEQLVRVEEYYNNLGLYMIPYGRNRLDLQVPSDHKLEFEGGGMRMMQDLLHRSRMRFPGTALGFIRRTLDEAVQHTRQRLIGGHPLAQFDQVQRHLARLQGWVTTARAFCRDSINRSGISFNLVKEGLIANIHKALMSDYMQSAAQNVLQLVGAKGYRQDHFAGRATTDSRPFQIFEGSNDVIYHQIGDGFLKPLFQTGDHNIARFLANHPLTARGVERVKSLLDFSVQPELSQRRRIDLGRIFSRVTAIDRTVQLSDAGFDSRLITNAVAQLKEEIGALVGQFFHGQETAYVDVDPKSLRL